MDREFGEFTTMARRENQRPPSHQSSTVSSEKEIAADDSPSRSWIRGFGPWPKGVRFNIAWHAPRNIILRRQPWCTRRRNSTGRKGGKFSFFRREGVEILRSFRVAICPRLSLHLTLDKPLLRSYSTMIVFYAWSYILSKMHQRIEIWSAFGGKHRPRIDRSSLLNRYGSQQVATNREDGD